MTKIDDTLFTVNTTVEKKPSPARIKKKVIEPSPFISTRLFGEGDPLCGKCSLYGKTKVNGFGNFRMKIMIVGEAPGKTEEERGKPFVGESGQILRDSLEAYGIDMDNDCYTTNAVMCRPTNNKTPSIADVRKCFPRLEKEIMEHKPSLILAMGDTAIGGVLIDNPLRGGHAGLYRGKMVPNRIWNCWVGGVFHPAYIMRNMDALPFFNEQLKNALTYLVREVPLPDIPNPEDNKLLTNIDDIKDFFDYITNNDDITVAFDFETSGLSPFAVGARILTASFSVNEKKGICIPINHSDFTANNMTLVPEIKRLLVTFLESSTKKVVQNLQFEQRWAEVNLKCDVNNVVEDTMLTAHVLDSTTGATGLDYLVYKNYGYVYGKDLNKADLDNEPLTKVASYNSMDTRFTASLLQSQRNELYPDGSDACKLLKCGAEVFTRMHIEGVKLDHTTLDEMRIQVNETINKRDAEIKISEAAQKFKVATGRELKYTSTKDLSELLFNILKVGSAKLTSHGSYSVDAEALTEIHEKASLGTSSRDNMVVEILAPILEIRKYEKLSSTYIHGVSKLEDDDGYVHPEFLLNTVATFRSSSANPNFQNIPKRGEVAKQFRKLIVPKRDLLIECDYSAAEVRVMAMYSQDRNLIKFLNEHYDMHTSWTAKIFQKPESEVLKAERDMVKNQWTFPLFYGSYFQKIADNTGWDAFLLKSLEEEFWSVFSGIKNWKYDVKNFYKRNGYVTTYTKFRRYGPLSNNQIINTPIQSTAFHLLLYGLIDFEKELREKKMKSRPIIQVHDSVLIDAVKEERDELIEMMLRHFTNKRFIWMGDVNMEIGIEEGLNWSEMVGYNNE